MTTKTTHTPGPMSGTFDPSGELPCGCILYVGGKIQWCSLHASAQEMRALIRDITGPRGVEWNVTHWQRAVALLARIEATAQEA